MFIRVLIIACLSVFADTRHSLAQSISEDDLSPEGQELVERLSNNSLSYDVMRVMLGGGYLLGTGSAEGALPELLSPVGGNEAAEALSGIDAIERRRTRDAIDLHLLRHDNDLSDEERRFWEGVRDWTRRSPADDEAIARVPGTTDEEGSEGTEAEKPITPSKRAQMRRCRESNPGDEAGYRYCMGTSGCLPLDSNAVLTASEGNFFCELAIRVYQRTLWMQTRFPDANVSAEGDRLGAERSCNLTLCP